MDKDVGFSLGMLGILALGVGALVPYFIIVSIFKMLGWKRLYNSPLKHIGILMFGIALVVTLVLGYYVHAGKVKLYLD